MYLIIPHRLRLALIFFCFHHLNLVAAHEEYNDEGIHIDSGQPLFVNLGSYCEMALRLRDCGIRQAAYPFDWLICKELDSFITILDEDFLHFTSEEYFMRSAIKPIWVKNSYYRIYFKHDWPFPDEGSDAARYAQQLQDIQDKYARRIERFRQIKNYQGQVFFFHSFWIDEGPYFNAVQAQKLKDALERYFSDAHFTLVIVNYTDSQAPAIVGIDDVIEFKIRREFNLPDFQAMINYLLLL